MKEIGSCCDRDWMRVEAGSEAVVGLSGMEEGSATRKDMTKG